MCSQPVLFCLLNNVQNNQFVTYNRKFVTHLSLQLQGEGKKKPNTLKPTPIREQRGTLLQNYHNPFPLIWENDFPGTLQLGLKRASNTAACRVLSPKSFKAHRNPSPSEPQPEYLTHKSLKRCFKTLVPWPAYKMHWYQAHRYRTASGGWYVLSMQILS